MAIKCLTNPFIKPKPMTLRLSFQWIPLLIAAYGHIQVHAQSLRSDPARFSFVDVANDYATPFHVLPIAHPKSSFRAFNAIISTENEEEIPSDFKPLLVVTYANGKQEKIILVPFQEAEARMGVFRSDLVYVSTSIQSYQISWPDQNLSNLKVVAEWFDPGAVVANPNQANDGSPNLRANCSAPLPSYVNRVAWNCPSGEAYTTPPASYTQVTHLIVHHSAGVNTSSNWPQVVLSIWNYHVNSNGWSDIAYNWLIDPNGVVYEGRGGGDNVLGAHFCGTNAGTMGVCMLGNFQQVEVAQKAFDSLVKILTWKACARNLDPNQIAFHPSSGLQLYRVSGHRDGCTTECPGDNLYRLLPQVRSRISTVLNPSTGTKDISDMPLKLAISPNPGRVSESIWLNFESQGSKNGTLIVFDAQGQVMQKQTLRLTDGKNTWLLNIPQLTKGQYVLRWEDLDGHLVLNQRLILIE